MLNFPDGKTDLIKSKELYNCDTPSLLRYYTLLMIREPAQVIIWLDVNLQSLPPPPPYIRQRIFILS